MYRRIFYRMLMIYGIAAVLLIGVAEAFAQWGEHRAHAYLFAAPGGSTGSGSGFGSVHLGGGAEIFLTRGLAVSPEIGYLAPWNSFGNGFGVFSTNGTYHFRTSRKLMPFATGGYSLGFRNGTQNMANFGGGVDYWLANNHALRLELRDHYAPGIGQHYLGFRVGWSFR